MFPKRNRRKHVSVIANKKRVKTVAFTFFEKKRVVNGKTKVVSTTALRSANLTVHIWILRTGRFLSLQQDWVYKFPVGQALSFHETWKIVSRDSTLYTEGQSILIDRNPHQQLEFLSLIYCKPFIKYFQLSLSRISVFMYRS